MDLEADPPRLDGDYVRDEDEQVRYPAELEPPGAAVPRLSSALPTPVGTDPAGRELLGRAHGIVEHDAPAAVGLAP